LKLLKKSDLKLSLSLELKRELNFFFNTCTLHDPICWRLQVLNGVKQKIVHFHTSTKKSKEMKKTLIEMSYVFQVFHKSATLQTTFPRQFSFSWTFIYSLSFTHSLIDHLWKINDVTWLENSSREIMYYICGWMRKISSRNS
jgi:hypothetical protein